SFGPFDLRRGDIAPFTFAIVAGQSFHPGKYYTGATDFTNLGLSALWAGWIYDNPGVDTDGDGYKGEYHIFCLDSILSRVDTNMQQGSPTFDTIWYCRYGDTIYYQGDGVPDFKGASPPPSPTVTLFPGIDKFNRGQIIARWNGQLSETTPDQFSQQIDFEGYRVYTSLTGKVDDYSLLSSYDVENYDRWEYDKDNKIWNIVNRPYTMSLLRQMYGDNFNPTYYYNSDHLFAFYNFRTRKYEEYYFTRHDWNQSNYRDTTKIHKVYPDQPYPSTLNRDSAAMFYPNEVTSEGQLKYFEYEYILKHLLPSQQYYMSVTVFDQGFPAKGLRPLETAPNLNAQREFAQNSSALVREKKLNVIVYPNPYRIDANYRERFEGWERPDLPESRIHTIHFTNLPNRCTIKIYTLAGDLIRKINHDFAEGQAGSMHESWDLISRNTMEVVSGIYYYTVESEIGNQIGKLVIIR
ncbi:MAG: T9SS type A sorting domain-containing protein, partial [candidate division Zixibacteria bacterium]|nr:T9SS type A sorting domain-containing protein [candidate division Zixibacteria bacterium]